MFKIWKVDTQNIGIGGHSGGFDAGTAEDITATEGLGISPLWAMQTNYATLPDSVYKVIARKKEVDHGEPYQPSMADRVIFSVGSEFLPHYRSISLSN